MDIRSAQQHAWDNKLAKGFNTTDVALEFGLLTAEVGEAFTAWRKKLPDFGEELADVVLYVAALAEMNGIDLESEVERKLAKNRDRVYVRDERGVLHRIETPGGAADGTRSLR
ncbi:MULTISPECIES: MazG-like family protein [unclassified Streptomyces]|uniref:MazG-like family protein n=1 Tax=unclassified Streptomyces TaxID=2593676 RepID=UPI00342A4F42